MSFFLGIVLTIIGATLLRVGFFLIRFLAAPRKKPNRMVIDKATGLVKPTL